MFSNGGGWFVTSWVERLARGRWWGIAAVSCDSKFRRKINVSAHPIPVSAAGVALSAAGGKPMADANLVDFVRAALERGEARARIKEVLKKAGWPADQVDSALNAFADLDFPVPVPSPRSYGSAREAFLYIVYFSLLGMIAGNVGGLAFAWIDRQFADELATNPFYSWATTGMRWSIASLLVGYPIFLFLGWRLAAKKRKDPERRRSRVHAWLTYVTLIFAAGALIGDLVAVVFQFLSGELQSRFLAKAAVVGVISGAILWNYSRDVERHSSRIDFAGRLLALISMLVVGALVAWAFTIVRGPGAARYQLADEQRIAGLTETTRLVDCYYTYFDALPESLETMGPALAGRAERAPVADGCALETPTDPTSGGVYDYRAIDADSYELCAIFLFGWPDAEGDAREWQAGGYYYYAGAGQRARKLQKPTGAGEACFEIDAVRVEDEETPARGSIVEEAPAETPVEE
jgi:MFS family permease